jgi:hypothetical protein
MRRSVFMCMGALAALGGTLACGGAVVSPPASSGTGVGAANGAAAPAPAPGGNFGPFAGSSGTSVGGTASSGVGSNGASASGTASSATPSVITAPTAVGPGLPGLVTLAAGQTCPWGMAIDATSVYWTTCGDPTSGNVLKVPKAGGDIVTLAAGDRLSGIAVDGTSVYWVAGTFDASSGAIMKVPVGGGTPTTLTSRPGAPAHLAVDASYVYWAEQMPGSIMKVPLTGGPPTQVAPALPAPWQIALDDADVYWMGQGLMKAPKVGGAAIELTPRLPMLPTAGLAVNATNVYFTSGPPGGTSGVSTISSQGGTATVIYADTSGDFAPPGPIAIDATRAYWADASNAVHSVPLNGGAATTLATGQNNVIAIAVDETAVYWLANGNGSPGSVMKLPLAALDAVGH